MSVYRVLRGRVGIGVAVTSLFALLTFFLPGCGGVAIPGDDDSSLEPSSYEGEITGLVSDSRSTRESVDETDVSSAQVVPPDFDPSDVDVTFEDLDGQPLVDANGQPYPPLPVDDTGAFEAQNLPVGVDIIVAVDLDGDGEPDIRQIIQIPADETGLAGEIDDVMVDPLTTLIVEKLMQLLEEQGVDVDGLEVSPTAVVHRLVDAFTHLFEESGVDRSVTIDDLRGLQKREIAALFESVIPAAARTGMSTLEGNLALCKASELEDMIKAGAEVFLRAGFPIADDPGGIDLAFLGDLPDVEVLSIHELHPPDEQFIEVAQLEDLGLDSGDFDELLGDGTLDDLLGDGTLEDLIADGALDEYLDDGTIDPELLDQIGGTLPETVYPDDQWADGEGPIIYRSTITEPDRNFIANDEFAPDEGGSHLPILNEHLIERVAAMHLERRVITVQNLHRLITDEEVGMGARVTYMLPMPGYAGPPPMVFETADGGGIERNVDQMLFDLFDLGVTDPAAGFEDMQAKHEQVREMMREMLQGTEPPSLERLFGAILSERIEHVNQLIEFIRNAKAHLPFNRSGSSTFYVIADGDPWRPDAPQVNPISVNIEFGADGFPSSITYDPTNAGPYFLSFTHETESRSLVEILVRETGRWLHGPHGEPLIMGMADETLFQPVDGRPFLEFVSEAGTFWPGIPVTVSNPDHYMDAEIQPASTEGPTMELYVLASAPGPDAEPVRVAYDAGTGIFSSDPNGRYYLMFLPETNEEGVFGLYDIDMNFMATVNDLTQETFVENLTSWEPMPYPDEPPPPEDQVAPDDTIPDDGTIDEPPDDLLPASTADDTTTVTEPVDDPPLETEQPVEPDATIPPDDGQVPEDGATQPDTSPLPVFEMARVRAQEVVGLDIQPEYFTFVFGTEVANENFDPNGNPFFDDVNGNGIEDPGEFTADFRPMLFNPDDWRSTDISRYYRTQSGQAVVVQEVDFESPEPMTIHGEALVPRTFLPRLNAFKFGRPNSAINLLTSFLPPEFFDGTHSLNEDTRLNIMQAIAMINLVMEQAFNAHAMIDIDGPGPFEPQQMLIDAHLFVTPIGDPFVLMLGGFEQLCEQRINEDR